MRAQSTLVQRSRRPTDAVLSIFALPPPHGAHAQDVPGLRAEIEALTDRDIDDVLQRILAETPLRRFKTGTDLIRHDVYASALILAGSTMPVEWQWQRRSLLLPAALPASAHKRQGISKVRQCPCDVRQSIRTFARRT